MCLGEVVQIVDVTDRDVLARAGTRTIAVSLLTLDVPVAVGDWVLAHSGFALARLSPEEALEARRLRAFVPSGPELDPSSGDPIPTPSST
jgi:hydrogenase expression/formation protein HypC